MQRTDKYSVSTAFLPRVALVGLLLAGLTFGSTAAPASAVAPAVPAQQLLLVREAARVIETVGDDLWQDWSRAPKTTLIIESEREFLLSVPRGVSVPGGFEPLGQSFMGRPVYQRPRRLSSTLRTTFPIGGIPTAVVGAWRPEIETPNEWVITLVEQWFQVLRLTRGEQAKVAELELAPREVPSWQVDYAFPFDDPDVGHAMLLLGQTLFDFWSAGSRLPREGQRAFQATTAWAAIKNLQTVLTLKYGPEAYKYLQLQLWRDGATRYSGILVAREMARAELVDDYEHVRGFDELREQQSYVESWDEHVGTRFWMIGTAGRDGERDRTSFQALGHGMAELLDSVNPDWKQHYFDRGVWLDDLVSDMFAGPDKAAVRR